MMFDLIKSCYVYILEGSDGTYYTGMTWNLRVRIMRHNGLLWGGAKFTKSRRPWLLIYFERYPTRSEAAKREYEIKHMTKDQKRALAQTASKEDLLSAV